jgi:hypothetical protein
LARAATENVGLFPKLAVSDIKQDKKPGQAFQGKAAWETAKIGPKTKVLEPQNVQISKLEGNQPRLARGWVNVP